MKTNKNGMVCQATEYSKEFKNQKYSNKRYTLSFTLKTNNDGNKIVLRELNDFINSKDWSTEVVKINSYEY